MKFAKILSDQAATVLPGGLQALFPYKALKKKFKGWASTLDAADNGDASGGDSCSSRQTRLRGCQQELLCLLGAELRHLNQTFMEREELLVISWQLLSEEVSRTVPMQPGHAAQHKCQDDRMDTCEATCVPDTDQLQDLLQLLVNFHGDAVLLMNWSHVNYNAVAKALKKFDKKFGCGLRAPVMQQVVAQPFCSTRVVSSLTHRAELLVNQLTERLQTAARSQQPAESSHRTTGSGGAEAAPSNAQQGSFHKASLEHETVSVHGVRGPAVTASPPSGAKRPRDGTCAGQRVRGAPVAAAALRPRRSVESARRVAEEVTLVAGSGPNASQMAVCATMSRRVQAALDTWHSLAVGASTPSTVVVGHAAAPIAGCKPNGTIMHTC